MVGEALSFVHPIRRSLVRSPADLPISTAILRLNRLQHATVLLVVLWPPCVFLGVVGGVGFLISRLKM